MEYTPTDPPPDLVEAVAILCHEATRFFNATLQGPHTAHGPWPNAPEWLCELQSQEAAIVVANPKITVEELHCRWIEVIKAAGWTFGDEIDPDAKTIPSLRPWAEIPETARAFDRLRLEIARFAITVFDPEPAAVITN